MVATVLLALGLDNRQAALSLSQFYAGDYEPQNIFTWIYSLQDDDVQICTNEMRLRDSLLRFLRQLRRDNAQVASPDIEEEVDVILYDGAPSYPPANEQLLTEIAGSRVRLFERNNLDYVGMVEIANSALIGALESRTHHLFFGRVYRIDAVEKVVLQIGQFSD